MKRQRHALSTSSSSGEATSGLVVLTREALKNVPLQRLLEAKGVQSLSLPCIAHQAAEGLPKLPQELMRHWDYVVVTSPHAATVLKDAWQEAGKPAMAVACIGKGTQAALNAGGIEAGFVPSKATGKSLVEELPAAGELRGQVLYPTSALADNTIEEGLRAKVRSQLWPFAAFSATLLLFKK